MKQQTEMDLLCAEALEEMAAFREILGRTRTCPYHATTDAGPMPCHDACDDFEELKKTIDRTIETFEKRLAVIH